MQCLVDRPTDVVVVAFLIFGLDVVERVTVYRNQRSSVCNKYSLLLQLRPRDAPRRSKVFLYSTTKKKYQRCQIGSTMSIVLTWIQCYITLSHYHPDRKLGAKDREKVFFLFFFFFFQIEIRFKNREILFLFFFTSCFCCWLTSFYDAGNNKKEV